jgi:hypothetical protein
MKKYVIFVALLPLIIGLVACASGSENASTTPTEPGVNSTATTEPENNPVGETVETPPPPSLPVSAPTREEILAELYAQQETLKLCDDVFDRYYSQTASQVFSLDEQTYLIQLGCFLAAYQTNFEFWQYNKTESGGTFTPLMLTSFNENENESGDPIRQETKTLAGLATYSPATRSLNILTKYRGIGDCGSMADYQLKNGKFELVKYQAKFDCDGNYIEPDEYPQIFP